MEQRSKSKRSWFAAGTAADAWFGRVQNLYGVYLALGGATVSGYFGITEDFPLYVLISVALLTLCGISLSFSLAKSKRDRNLLLCGVTAICLGTVAISARRQHLAEQKREAELAELAEQYTLEYAGLAPEANYVRSGGIGSPRRMDAYRFALAFNNPNDFTVWVKTTRRYVAVNGRTSGDPQESSIGRVPPFGRVYKIGDLPIYFQPPLNITPTFDVTIDFSMCYSRDRSKLDKGQAKGFVMKGTFVHTVSEDGTVKAANFYPAEQVEETYGFTETCKS